MFKNGVFRVDPRTILAAMLLLNVVMFSAGFTGGGAVARLIFVAVPALLAIQIERYFAAGIYLVISLGTLGLEQWLLEVSWTGGIGNVSLLLSGVAGLIARLSPCIFMGYVAIVSIKVGELMAALERSHVPRQLVIPAAVVLRFLPAVREESGAVASAMTARGISLRGVGVVSWLEYRLVPLIISVVKSGEELTQAALTRGLGKPGVANRIADLRFRLGDAALICVCAVGLGFWIVV